MKQTYFMKIARGVNAHGETLYEHAYFDSLEEAMQIKQKETEQGNETSPIIATNA